jgi:putative endonuclease
MYYYVYVLESSNDHNLYVGYTKDLKKRIAEHNAGKVESTRNRKPMKLVYWEGSLSQKDALKRETYLKTAWGKRYLKNRMGDYLTW